MTGCKKNGLLAIAARNSTLNSALGRRFQSELCQWRSPLYRSEGGGALEAWGTSASPMREPPIVDRRSHHKPPSGSCRANHRRVSIQVTGTPVTLAPLLPASLAQPRRGRFRFLLSGRSAFYCTNRAAVHTFRGARPMEDIIRNRDSASAHRDRDRRARAGGGTLRRAAGVGGRRTPSRLPPSLAAPGSSGAEAAAGPTDASES